MALFGGRGSGETLGDGPWAVLPEGTVCVAVVGDSPTRPHFTSAARFRWAAERPRDEEPRFASETFQGRSRQPSHTTWLFVRRAEWSDYLCAGRLAPPTHWGHGADGWFVDFELSPTLPTTAWTALRGTPPAGSTCAGLDAMLRDLGPSTTPDVRFATLQALVEFWHGPIGVADGLTEAALDGLHMPPMLKRWYRWAGRRDDILSGQNFLLSPDRLRDADRRLLFYTENQACYFWATLLDGDDPPVFGREDERDAWQPEGMRLSEHLILAALLEAIIRFAPYGATAWADRRQFEEIARVIPPLAIPPWRWCGRTQFHAGGGAFMIAFIDAVMDGRPRCDIWIGAKEQEPLLFLRSLSGIDWNHAAF